MELRVWFLFVTVVKYEVPPLQSNLDRETTDNFHLVVVAEDNGPTGEKKSTTADINIK